MEILSKAKKKALVIKLYKEGKKYKEITEIVRISSRDIGRIVTEYTGEKTTNYTQSNTTKVYALFLKGKSPIEVAIKLDLKFEDVKRIYLEYLYLQDMKTVEIIYKNYKGYLNQILQIIDNLKNGEITVGVFNEFCKYLKDIPTLQRVEGELRHKVNMLKLKEDVSA